MHADCLTDFFTEYQRLSGRRRTKTQSPLEAMQDVDFVQTLLREGMSYHRMMNSQILRTELMRKLIECTPFRPSLAVDIVRFFKGRRILDPCAGWGDRMIGALAADPRTDYTGYDPNPALVTGHCEIAQTFGEGRARVICEPFETAVLQGKYDLVFTSFPFYDVEVYTSAPGQSIDNYPTLDEWMHKFLFRSLFNAWSVLTTNGHMVIHAADSAKCRLCEPMVKYCMESLDSCRFVGRAYATVNDRHYHPLWVFVKIN